MINEIIQDVTQAVSNLYESAAALIVSIVDEYIVPGNCYAKAFAIACEDHRMDIWLESRGRMYPTQHRQADVEHSARLILSGARTAARRNFEAACIGLVATAMDIGRTVTATIQQTVHVAIASGIDMAAAVAEFLSGAIGKVSEYRQDPPMSLWDQYQRSLAGCECLSREVDIMVIYERVIREGW
ncbi:MAG: hypothetical protein HGA31_06310 [Candidatus Moranbacteria bacterium]|nr:hypothetical protein [Candidatus Moranbacteria bacterium]